LEFLFGTYQDLFKDFVWIDNKSAWIRYFKTKNGIIEVHDIRGTCSIGYVDTLTDDLKSDIELFSKSIKQTIPIYRKLKREALNISIKRRPVENFIKTFAAVVALLKQANNTNSLFEGLVLYAALTDALLRHGVLLQRQLLDRSESYDPNLIYQKSPKKFISERQVINLASKEKLISKTLESELSRLYNLRNRAIHRYFISNFEYAELPSILSRYGKAYSVLSNKIAKLEAEQVKTGVGMIKQQYPHDKEGMKSINRDALTRIDSTIPQVDIPERKQIDWEKATEALKKDKRFAKLFKKSKSTKR